MEFIFILILFIVIVTLIATRKDGIIDGDKIQSIVLRSIFYLMTWPIIPFYILGRAIYKELKSKVQN